MPIDAVIFDIGNVLIEWQPERYYDRTIGTDRRKAMFRTVDLHAMNDRIDRGDDAHDVIYSTADRYPQWGDEIRQWHDNWHELAQPQIDHSVRLLGALRKKGHPVFALTNFGDALFARAQTLYPFLNDFDRFYVSGRMKMAKPDPDIYEALEKDCGVSPGHLLFADDRADNIAIAQDRGWQTHLFEHARGWADRLVAEDLLTPAEAA